MKIIEPNVELWEQIDEVTHVARCARICYRKETGNDERLIQNLKLRKHFSMFRHATYYFVIPKEKATTYIIKLYILIRIHNNKIIGIDIDGDAINYYIVTNGNWNLDHPDLISEFINYQVSPKEFANFNCTTYNMMRYTFKVTTQISTSRELNRVSPNNIAEQSTRYVYEDSTICRPHWMTKEEANYLNTEPIFNDDWIKNHALTKRYIWTVDNSFHKYRLLIDNGMHRQDARGVLPIDTATVCAYTYSAAEWRAIIDLRYYGTTGQPHPNAKIIAGMIREELIKLGYEFR